MAIALDLRQSGTSSASAATLSWTHTVGSSLSNTILLVMCAESSGTGISVSGINWDDAGTPVALTRKGRIQDSVNGGWAEIWYLLNPVPGAKTIKVTFTAACAATTGSVSFSGVDQSVPFNASSPQTATGTTTTATVNVTSAVGERVVDCVEDNENQIDTLVVGGGQTTIHNITVGSNTAGGSSDEAGAASVTMSWTGVGGLSAPWAIIGVSLRPASDVTFYLNNPIQGGSNAGLLDLTAPTASTSTTGWTVGTTGSANYSRLTYNTEVPAANFTGTAQPSGVPVNSGEDCFRLSAVTTGQFSAGTWYSTLSVLAVTSGGVQDGRARFRLWKSASADLTSATELTQGAMIGSSTTGLSTNVAQSSSASTQIAASNLTNEFLIMQVAWEPL